ncbi:hypothetical protein [Lentibacter sp. XHP0401]|uniref:hypothetical protein n=1 Tax=Lentibacter sp. XHP0401 TaxID=2984334 RepID=UPI0021E72285|nr:hypothetical protein [Lentibacter sp. XHP0401]MCV2893718.1 hypothetical protein [Lentibacter sp. XHP0401]
MENEVKDVGWALVFILFFVFALLLALPRYLRLKSLTKKYGDGGVAKKILSRSIWQGMTKGMLLDSRGRPAAKDERVMKSKTREVFKYGKTGKNRFDMTVTLENDFVVGWTQK